MLVLKKLIFAPVFLLFFALLIYNYSPVLKSYEAIFALSSNVLINLMIISALIFFSSIFFVIFASLANSWKFSLPIAVLASSLPMILVNQPLGIILSAGCLVSFIVTLVLLDSGLKKYLDFQPAAIFGPPIKNLTGFLILSLSLTYFVSVSTIISQKGFEIPDSLIETSLKLVSQPQPEKTATTPEPQLTIPPEQLELLKQNPDLLQQYGLDLAILDALAKPENDQSQKPPTDLLTETVKQTIKDQLQNIIKPYLGIMPAVLAVLLFLILQSLISILNLLIYPLLWIIFYLLEKTGFVKFIEEQRPAKKMVI